MIYDICYYYHCTIIITTIARAFPCNGNNGNNRKEYCAGYHDGAVQAHRDFKTADDMDVDQHQCKGSTEYCNEYDKG
jgi:hypothetical protein